MRTILLCIAAALALGAGSAAGQERALPMLVSSAWLDEHRNDPDLVVLHMAYTRGEYLREHIPGARFLWFYGLVTQTPDEMTVLAPAKQVEKTLEEAGVGDRSKIVIVYGGNAFIGATRVFYTLDSYGLGHRTAVLDGGLEAWKTSGRAVTTEEPKARKGKLSTPKRRDVSMDAATLARRLHDANLVVVDARSKQAYDGTGAVRVLRPGHIAGATNLPASQLTDSLGMVKSPEKLQSLFAAAGVTEGKEVVTYCNVGQTASGVYFAARLLELPVRLYDGSMDEWMYRGDTFPIEVSPAPASPSAPPPTPAPAPAPTPVPTPGR